MSDDEDADAESVKIPPKASRRVSFQQIKSRVDSYLSSISNLNFIDLKEDGESAPPRTYRSFIELSA